MLHITKRVDYALIALTHLTLHRDERFAAREIAETYHLSRPLMANVLKELSRGELVRSVRGTKGGYEILLDPATLPVGRVVELLEGPIQIAACIGDDLHQPSEDNECCSAASVCPVKHSVFRIHARIRDVLYGQSIADLARDGARKRSSVLPVVEN
jgi:Rrf2 family protein